MKLLATLTFLLTTTFCLAQSELKLDTLHFKGKYNGKNLFVKNPFNGTGNKGFSVQSVVLDKKVMEVDFNTSAFEVKLDAADRKVGDDLNLVIIHISGFVPEILNLEVLDDK